MGIWAIFTPATPVPEIRTVFTNVQNSRQVPTEGPDRGSSEIQTLQYTLLLIWMAPLCLSMVASICFLSDHLFKIPRHFKILPIDFIFTFEIFYLVSIDFWKQYILLLFGGLAYKSTTNLWHNLHLLTKILISLRN